MIYMNNYLIDSTPLLISPCLLWGCNNEDVSTSSVETEVVELDEYESVIRLEDNVLANPYMVRYDSETNHLFIYDYGSNSILEIDSAGEVIREFGGQGQGPGEVQGVNNFFLTSNHLYIIRSEEHTSELQSRVQIVRRLLLEKTKFSYKYA